MRLYKNKLLLIKGIVKAPDAKLIEYKATKFTALPWTANTYQALIAQNMVNVPAPISGYDFSKSPYKPYAHQRATVNFFLANPKAFCWNDAGTGKTACCLWALDYLLQQHQVTKILIICPLTTSEAVWGSDCEALIPHETCNILIGNAAKRAKLFNKSCEIFIINHDGIKTMEKELAKWRPDLIIVDEHTAFKNQRTQRFRSLRAICKRTKYIWMLSATPMPQAPTDVYAPAKIICPDAVGRSFVRFRDLVMLQISMHKWVPRDNFEKIIAETVKPAIRFSRDDCLDLPNIIYQDFEVKLSKKQALAFKELRRDAILLLDEGEVTAVNAGVMHNKLLQCCSGYVYDTNHYIVDLTPGPRLEALKELISESRRGVLVFLSYKSAMTAVNNYLKNEFSTAVINGDTKLKDRTSYFELFQNGKIKVLLAHPRTMAHGITLTAADTIIWYSVTSDNELYPQANARIQRIGQTHKMRVVHLIGTKFEKNILKRLKQKEAMQGLLLETFGNNS